MCLQMFVFLSAKAIRILTGVENYSTFYAKTRITFWLNLDKGSMNDVLY
jgi:hypothetical protein